jgi:hypothetical protein
VRVKSESGSLRFVFLRSHTKTHTFITNIEGFLPFHQPFDIFKKIQS